MSRKLLNVALAILVLSAAYRIVVDDGVGQTEVVTQVQADSLMGVEERSEQPRKWKNTDPLDAGIEQTVYETFAFDPNTADTTALLRLGFSRWMVRNILKYRASGGRYRTPESVKSMPGMTPELYDRIAAYITIDPKFQEYDRDELARERKAARDMKRQESVDSTTQSTDGPRHEKLSRGETIDLNTADSAMLCRVPGIGAWRAKCIMRYRDELGGYASITQLGELKDVPDSCQRWFVVTGNVRKLNINTATMGEMKRHPYIGFYRAKAIEGYRHRYGRLQSVDDLLKLPDFSADDVRRLVPYIEM